MHTGFFNFRHPFDGSRQLALQCLQVFYPILKFGGPEFTFIKNFKPFVAAGQSLPRQFQTGLIHIFFRNADRCAIPHDLVGNLQFLKLCHNVAGILALHFREQRNVLRLASRPVTGAQHCDKEKQRGTQHDPALSWCKTIP